MADGPDRIFANPSDPVSHSQRPEVESRSSRVDPMCSPKGGEVRKRNRVTTTKATIVTNAGFSSAAKFSQIRHSRMLKVAYGYFATLMRRSLLPLVAAIPWTVRRQSAAWPEIRLRYPTAGYHKIPGPGVPLIAVPTTSVDLAARRPKSP